MESYMFMFMLGATSLICAVLFASIWLLHAFRPTSLEQNTRRSKAARDHVVQETRPWE
jgi:hypothetical protein